MRYSIKALLSISLGFMLLSNFAFAIGQQERSALDILMKKIKEDKLYQSHKGCFFFMMEGTENTKVDIAVREKHGGRCAGDPSTAPILDRFQVDTKTKAILWYYSPEGEYKPYKMKLESKKYSSNQLSVP